MEPNDETDRWKTADESQLQDNSSIDHNDFLATSSRIDRSTVDRNNESRRNRSFNNNKSYSVNVKPTMADFTCMFPEVGDESAVHQSPLTTTRRRAAAAAAEEEETVEKTLEESLRCYCGGRPSSSKCRINMRNDKTRHETNQCSECFCPEENRKK